MSLKFDGFDEFKKNILLLMEKDSEFFSGMETKSELGKIIEIANQKPSYEEKAEKFLELIRKDDKVAHF